MLRDRYADLADAVARAEDAAEAEARCVLQAVRLRSEGSYPTTGGLFFSALPQTVTGLEKEGATPVLSDAAAAVYPYVAGATAPAAGDRLVAGLVPYRWATTPPVRSSGPCGLQMIATRDGCNLAAMVPGVDVTLLQGGSVVGSCTTVAQVISLGIQARGSGFTEVPTLTINPPASGTTATGTCTIGASLATLSLDNPGSGYTTLPTVSFSGGGGSGATASVTLASTSVASVTIESGGTGYTQPPTLLFSAGSTTRATATATVANGAITGITITNPGAGYTAPPTIGISALDGGHGAILKSVMNPVPLGSLTLGNTGDKYTSNPTVVFTGGGGSGAAASATLGSNHLTSVTLTDGGSGYLTEPAVTISTSGGDGTATVLATVDAVCSIPVPSAGTYTFEGVKDGYSNTPSSGTITCPNPAKATVAMYADRPVPIQVQGCVSGPFASFGGDTVQVTITEGGTTIATGTPADPGSYVTPPLPVNGTYTANVTDSSGRLTWAPVDFVPLVVTFNQFGQQCSTPTVTLPATAVAGYHCTDDCFIPLKDTLTVQDSQYGAITVTFGDWSVPSCQPGTVTGWFGSIPDPSGVFDQLDYFLPWGGIIPMVGSYRASDGASSCGTPPSPYNSPSFSCQPGSILVSYQFDSLVAVVPQGWQSGGTITILE